MALCFHTEDRALVGTQLGSLLKGQRDLHGHGRRGASRPQAQPADVLVLTSPVIHGRGCGSGALRLFPRNGRGLDLDPIFPFAYHLAPGVASRDRTRPITEYGRRGIAGRTLYAKIFRVQCVLVWLAVVA